MSAEHLPADHAQRRAFTQKLLKHEEDVLRRGFLEDPSLFHARFLAMRGDESQYQVMANHFNTEIDPRAWIEPDEVKRLIEGRMAWVPDDPQYVTRGTAAGESMGTAPG